jgi:hypothetical protein
MSPAWRRAAIPAPAATAGPPAAFFFAPNRMGLARLDLPDADLLNSRSQARRSCHVAIWHNLLHWAAAALSAKGVGAASRLIVAWLTP